jgi:hypothetical protein
MKNLLQCPSCGVTFAALCPKSQASTRFEDCYRRCEPCGIGLSNARISPTVIYRDPLHNVPHQVRDGLLETLSDALNVRNRENKLLKFGFSTSEDALTWTVFSYLQRTLQLRDVLNGVLSMSFVNEPSLLLWGVPVPRSPSGYCVRDRLTEISNQLGENPLSRTEPDVVCDFGSEGLVVVEVKYRSPNDIKSWREGYNRYLSGLAFEDMSPILASGLYELARNWRFGWELAGRRPMVLVNLVLAARASEGKRIESFRSGLRGSDIRKFVQLNWHEFLGNVQLEDWIGDYLQAKVVGA